jgi:hypothetical protein
MLSTFGILAGRTCLEDWVLRGRPTGSRSFAAQLELALSIIDLHAFDPPAGPPDLGPNDSGPIAVPATS